LGSRWARKLIREEPLPADGPQEGHTQSALGQGVEHAVRGHGHEARQLGHASVAITEKHYTRWIPEAVPAVHQLDDAAEATGSKTGSLVASSSANLA
jgi:hypothetical protein